MAEHSLSDQEMVDILEGIARDARNAAAQIAAIKMLRSMRDGVKPDEEGFAQLYDVSERRNTHRETA